MTVTLKDIAKRVGKSVTTVSRALNDYDDVSPKTKDEIQRVASEMGYTPSSMAQRLRKQRSDSIGVILPTFGPRFSDPFFSEFLAGVGNTASEMGYDLMVSTRPPNDQEMEAYRLNVQGRRVDGFIIVRTRCEDPRIQYLHQVGFPFVAFGRTGGDLDFPFVDEDSEYGMQLIADHIVDFGHHRIACISAPAELTFTAQRLSGITKGLAKHGISLDEELIRESDLTQGGGFKQASILLDLPNPPSVIIACNDLMAFGAMSAAQERGLIVGEDIAITGFDDIPMAEHSHPPLTTLRQPIYRIGNIVCEMLIRIIQGVPLESDQVILKPYLVVRQSSGAYAKIKTH
jgi:LacI family transcriptional regulator